MSDDVLFSDAYSTELAALPRPHAAFVVSLLTRNEPAIVSFREQIAAWWGNLAPDGRATYADRLRSLENDDFFQAFSEVAVHEILRHHDVAIEQFAADPASWWVGRSGAADGDAGRFGLGVVAYLPEVQIRGSMSVYRHLVRELNQIHHHYLFSVYLKRWLPYDFDPRPIKRALEMWLDSLDDTSWHGKYAEYRDANIHLEFSILDKLREDRKGLVRFRISPLRSPEALQSLASCVDALVDEAEEFDPELPLVATIFSNEDWALPDMYLVDHLYGKADYSFGWTTDGGRAERVKSYTRKSAKYGLFAQERYDRLSAVVLADKEWERDKVVFSLRVFHNPWAAKPLNPDFFGDFAQHRVIEVEGDTRYMTWTNRHRARFRLP